MINRHATELMKGYSIFLLCLFIFTMWGINLFSLSQFEVLSSENDPDKIELVETGGMVNYKFKPRPFLYYYFAELGYKIDFSQEIPTDVATPMLLIEPPQQIDIGLLKKVFAWIRSGGKLIVFLSNSHPFDRLAGIKRFEHNSQETGRLHLHLPYLYDIETISPTSLAMQREPEASHFSIFTQRQETANVFTSFKGRGRIVLISHLDLTRGRGLKKADNLVFITRLLEYLGPDRRIHILDTEPDVLIRARGRRLVKKTGTKEVKKKFDHYSLWSLLKANPISWVLMQMAIALFVYFYSTTRRFGRPQSLYDQESASLSYVKNIGHLLENNNEAAHALQALQKDFIKAAVRRYNLAPEVSFHVVIEEIGKSSPEVARRLSNVEKDAFKILGGRNASPNALLRVVRALENARKELKLYD